MNIFQMLCDGRCLASLAERILFITIFQCLISMHVCRRNSMRKSNDNLKYRLQTPQRVCERATNPSMPCRIVAYFIEQNKNKMSIDLNCVQYCIGVRASASSKCPHTISCRKLSSIAAKYTFKTQSLRHVLVAHKHIRTHHD